MGRFAVQEGDTSCRWIAGNAGALPDCQPSLKRINVITLLIDLADRKVACLRDIAIRVNLLMETPGDLAANIQSIMADDI